MTDLPNQNWSLDDCKKFAVDCVEQIMLPIQKNELSHYSELFKNFQNNKPMYAGMKISSSFTFYMTKCMQSGIDLKIYGVALREVVEDYLPKIENWYNNKIQ